MLKSSLYVSSEFDKEQNSAKTSSFTISTISNNIAYKNGATYHIRIIVIFSFYITEMRMMFLPQVPFIDMKVSKSNPAIVNATRQVKIWRIRIDLIDMEK